MSYLGQTVQQFVPTYVVKSDYLPTRVVDGNAAQTSQLVSVHLLSSYVNMNRKREEEEYSHRDLLISTQIDMPPSEFMRMLKSTSPWTRINSILL